MPKSAEAQGTEADDRRLTKVEARYREAKRCGTCSMYVEGGRCTLVLGRIDLDDVCDHWDAK